MKLLQYAIVIISLLAFTSCESDLEKTIYDESKVKPAVLSGLEETYTLDKTKGSEDVLSLEWTKPDMGYQASVTSLLEMDLKEKHFNNPVILTASIEETAYSATVSDFNKKIMTLFKNHGIEYTEGETVELSFRIGSYISTVIDTVFSEVYTTTVTPYAGEAVYPNIVVVGNFCNWNFNACQYIYSENSDDNYAGMVYFDNMTNEGGNGGWKLSAEANWDNSTNNWGVNGNVLDEASEITLTLRGGNIKAYSKKSYWVEFNSSTGLLQMSQGYDSWGLVGSFNGWDASNAVDMIYGYDENGAYLALTREYPADATWKIISDKAWQKGEVNVNNVSYEGDVEDAGSDGNFKFNKGAGTYEVKWYFNKVQPTLIVTKK